MIKLENIERIYFIGIGGIGMSALARYFSFHGKKVSGYDRTETHLTKQLVNEGIEVTYSDDVNLAPKDAGLVVYTPAVPAEHAQLVFYRNNNYTVVKRSDVLGAITESSFNICISGTHGKTTISTMVAHILRHTGYGCNAFLGGISTNYNSNFWSSEKNVCVIEADEYDRSFLKLSPDIAVISAMDADHLDIYGTEKAMQDSFIEFSGKLKQGGTLITKEGLPRQDELKSDRQLKYSLKDKNADVFTDNIRLVNGYYLFDVKVQNEVVEEVALNMGGLHNVENASVAIAVAKQLKIDTEAVKLAVEEFRGVKRRFEYIVKKKSLVYIDDYAHHPEELSALISSAKNLFSDLSCTVIFQPHLFTRTRDFADGFAKSLDIADEVVLLPIYPARELPIEGVTSETISSKMKNTKVSIFSKNEVISYLKKTFSGNGSKNKLLITAGAGDIDTLVEPIKQILLASINGH
jgi:UDP-N-acetylmuramate--alanine ligase